jgi:ABC-type Zn uptake system ZnuABC Zn-binding protein ZnuA
MMGRVVQSWILIFFLVLALVSCSAGAAPDVLTTTTILADVARNVAGDRLTVGSLLPAGTDPHSYQPVPQDATMVERTKVLVVHGADFEGFLQPLLNTAGREENVIEASKGARLLSDEEGNDPHLWLDPNNVIVYVDNIREGLTQFDPDGADVYEANASAYIDHLTELDAWINGQIAQIEPKRRVLVTNHDAFGYFAEHYGFIVVGAVIPGYSSDSAPSAQQMAELIEQIKLYEAPAIFLDASDNPDLAKQIAAETGVKVISDLHLESLTEGAPAGTYIDMMRDNVTKIVQALQ